MCSCTSHERCKTSPSYQKSPSRPIQEVPRAAITIEHIPQYGVQHTPPRRCPTLRNSRWNRLALELLIWMRHSPQSSLPRRQLIEWIGKLATKGTHLLWWTSKVFFFFFFLQETHSTNCDCWWYYVHNLSRVLMNAKKGAFSSKNKNSESTEKRHACTVTVTRVCGETNNPQKMIISHDSWSKFLICLFSD